MSQSPGRGVQVQPDAGVPEVVAGEFADVMNPIAQRAAVDTEYSGAGIVVAAAIEVDRQSLDQIRTMFDVVIEESAEPVSSEPHQPFALPRAIKDVRQLLLIGDGRHTDDARSRIAGRDGAQSPGGDGRPGGRS